MRHLVRKCPKCKRKIILNTNNDTKCTCGQVIKNESKFVNFLKKCVGR